jgi:hypothetical protein
MLGSIFIIYAFDCYAGSVPNAYGLKKIVFTQTAYDAMNVSSAFAAFGDKMQRMCKDALKYSDQVSKF